MHFTVVFALMLLNGLTLTLGNQECGKRPITTRVVGGTDAQPNSWPWQISLRVKVQGKLYHICGGSLISPTHVVTAAHCVVQKAAPSRYKVVVGEHDQTVTEGAEQVFDVSSVCFHEGFSMQHLRNDIAVLTLSNPVALSDRVNTVCLPQGRQQVLTGTKCYITGWGRTIGGGKPANILQQAVMPVVDHQTCAKANKDLVPVDEPSMLCAGYATAGNVISGCQGDSGGPFVCEENGRFVLRGAVSWGHPRCEAENSYTVFARVSFYVDWINDKMAGGHGQGCAPTPAPPTKRPCFDRWPESTCRRYKGQCGVHTVRISCRKTCNFKC
ncbi:elastase-1-like isoform X2 [Orbicella faveolata]|uniref:elastase-1-like isoform X2 n=1 Tax=Orbicella faveolata TaxID=48498 RepID=UPI0009E44A66|nr:elastase-1-like isoform X2 [Orbicella faveolata]